MSTASFNPVDLACSRLVEQARLLGRVVVTEHLLTLGLPGGMHFIVDMVRCFQERPDLLSLPVQPGAGSGARGRAPPAGLDRAGHAGVVTGGARGGQGVAGVDFFVSHAGRDQAWAEWVAWHLVEAGYTVELDCWDWAA
ncbi:MAG: toll/interleukin-1 receptor domain-containing protein, partial [Pseudonocardiaceae bacterium]